MKVYFVNPTEQKAKQMLRGERVIALKRILIYYPLIVRIVKRKKLYLYFQKKVLQNKQKVKLKMKLTKIEEIGLNFFKKFNPKKISEYLNRVKLRRIKENMAVRI